MLSNIFAVAHVRIFTELKLLDNFKNRVQMLINELHIEKSRAKLLIMRSEKYFIRLT